LNKFSKYVCVGDNVEKEWNGLTLRAELFHDEFTTPDSFDCYSDEQIESWKGGDWFFGGIAVSLLCGDTILGTHLASLWGLDCNIVDDNTYLDEVAEELFSEAEDEVKKVVSTLANRLSQSVDEVTA
jgi:hypothetical protein